MQTQPSKNFPKYSALLKIFKAKFMNIYCNKKSEKIK